MGRAAAVQSPWCLTSLFHCLQPPDHRFNARPNLLVFLQQGGAFSGQRVLPLLQGPILVLKLIADLNESIYALLKSL